MRVGTYSERAEPAWWRPAPARAQAASTWGEANVDVPDSRVPFRALLAFTFILLFSPQSYFPVLAPLRIAMLTAAFAMLAHLYSRLARNRPLFDMNQGMWMVVLLVGWAILTVPFSYWPGGSVSYLLSDYFKTLVVFFLLANVVDSLPKLRRMSWVLVLLAVPLAWTTIKNYLSGVTLGNADRVFGYDAPLTGNPNDMALMLNLILPLAIALFLGSRRGGRRLLLGGIIALMTAAIVFTFSRAGFLALGVTFLCYFWLLRRRRERFWAPAALVLALAAVPFLPDSYFDRLSTITDIEADESGSAQTRWADMQAATGYVLTHPIIGAGIGQNVLAMNEVRGATWLMIHNVYLQYAMELGLPGLILFLLLYRACLRSTRQTMARARRGGMDSLFYIAEGLRVSLIAFSVEAFFHPVAYHFYFYIVAGLAMALSKVCDVEENAKGLARESN